MAVPLIQSYRVGRYIIGQKLRGNRRYPLVLMLEPLFRCNLACAGCGKIDYPDEILDKRLSVEECIGAAEECGAPIVSIAGGEPLIHKDMPEIVAGLVQRKRFVYLCTNALLLKKRMGDYQPSPYLTFSVHLDGNEHRHDDSVCQPGTYKRAATAIREAVEKGFRVTVNCTLFQGEGAEEVANFLDDCKALGVEGVTISPGFNYERAPQQEVFISGRRHGSSSATSSVLARSARPSGSLTNLACFWISLPVTRPINARLGEIRRATSLAGRSPVISSSAKAMPPVFVR